MQTHRDVNNETDDVMESDDHIGADGDNNFSSNDDNSDVVLLDPQMSNILEEASEFLFEEEAEEAVDECERIIEAHQKDGFCVDCTKEFIATGGEDDTAAVFRITDFDKPILRIQHDDSVTSVKFNSMGTLLATGDMSGKILITDMSDMRRRCEMDDCGDLEWLEWHSVADVLFAGGGDGVIWMYLVGKTGIAQTKTFVNRVGASCTVGKLLPDGKRLVTGYGNGTVLIWSLKDNAALTANINCNCRCTTIDVDRRQDWAIVGAENGRWFMINTNDGCLMLENLLATECQQVDVEAMEDESGEGQEPSVECARFCDTNQWVAVGGNLGYLGIYEISGSLRHVLPHDGQVVVKCAWLNINENSSTLVTASLDGKLRVWDARSGNLLKVSFYEAIEYCLGFLFFLGLHYTYFLVLLWWQR
uniref:WD_REPEATS_REGION domain-containing protein n=1 Tax=Syphacia muris TaxID=451379 RepID=A0A0N5AN74_9BILA